MGSQQAGGPVCKGYFSPGKRHLLKDLRAENTAGHLQKRLVRSEGAEEVVVVVAEWVQEKGVDCGLCQVAS